ncbi:hypothetical protein GGR07_002315 [Bacteroides pyogenes]|nr:hypothetical protein [Bacteroides pyogenes]SUV36219.1 Uncharacterised protein [Bacteroides pyogenes]
MTLTIMLRVLTYGLIDKHVILSVCGLCIALRDKQQSAF